MTKEKNLDFIILTITLNLYTIRCKVTMTDYKTTTI